MYKKSHAKANIKRQFFIQNPSYTSSVRVKTKRCAETTIRNQLCSGLDHNSKASADVPSIVTNVVQLRGSRAAPAVKPVAV
jgi:hypothetical protein